MFRERELESGGKRMGDGCIYEEAERDRSRGFMWSVGAKGSPRVFWGMCICVRTWWEPNHWSSLFYVSSPNANVDMDPISHPHSQLHQLHSFTFIKPQSINGIYFLNIIYFK